ncbi:ABC transporter ATP-binding protein [Nocardia tengchongensis]|uniref:ABC transporter ATP-binding protein n=1 Tax=Nocardia tengchongensis TaxID=2055889 RepID=UPI00367E1A2F
MITLADVRIGYGGALVLSGVGLTAETGSTVGLIGPNGSGKSTLLRVIYRALRPQSGTVLIDGTPVAALHGRDMAGRLAVVTQESPAETPVTVSDLVMLGRSPWAGAVRGYSRADRIAAAGALHKVGARHLAERIFSSLSGGERQRVLIARALAQQAQHLLLDEPTNHLDVHYQHELLSLLGELAVTTVIVLHDLNLAARYCDHLVLLNNGGVAAAGRVDDVLVPEVLEPVYRVRVHRSTAFGSTQLLFGPRSKPADAVADKESIREISGDVVGTAPHPNIATAYSEEGVAQ